MLYRFAENCSFLILSSNHFTQAQTLAHLCNHLFTPWQRHFIRSFMNGLKARPMERKCDHLTYMPRSIGGHKVSWDSGCLDEKAVTLTKLLTLTFWEKNHISKCRHHVPFDFPFYLHYCFIVISMNTICT